MGCDFYEHTYLRIKTGKGKGKGKEFNLRLKTENRYMNTFYDSDDETYEEAMDRQIKFTSTTPIYSDKKWEIKNTQKYMDILLEHKISFEEVTLIEKYTFCEER